LELLSNSTIHNYSDRPLSDDEKILLALGPFGSCSPNWCLKRLLVFFEAFPQNAKDIIKLLQLSVRLFMENENLNAQMEQHQVPFECQSRCTLDHTEEKSVADMSRAKQMKSLFRIITPHFTTKDIPCIVVNHTYQEQAMYPKTIMSGGTGPMYSANTVFIIGKQQEKEGTEVVGYNFIINVEKSRYVREKSKIPITVTHDGGISRWSGLLDMAIESGHVIKPTNGWYSRVDKETGEIEAKRVRIKDTDTKDFWLPIITSKSFQTYVEEKYRVSAAEIMQGGEEDLFDDVITMNGTENA
jgi:hypothetical protein